MKNQITKCFNGIVFGISFLMLSSCKPGANDIRLYVFDTGIIKATDGYVLGLDSGRDVTLGNACFLVVHPKGILLWDTGLADSLVEFPQGIREPLATMTHVKSLESQMNEIDISPDQVDFLALSHMHNDHTGNANRFAGSKVILQRSEFNIAFSDSASGYYFNPSTYDKLNRFEILDGKDFDVFGDGNIIIKSTPGHTAGHQSLFVKLRNTGSILISGDLYHHAGNRTNKKFPVFNFNKVKTMESSEVIENFLREQKGQIWIQHDPTFNANVNFSPAYYD